MTDPVDTDALRAVAAEMDNDDWTDWSSTEAHVNGEKVAAAAEEIDRLRAELDAWEPAWRHMRDERDRLRAVIENARHDRYCDALSESLEDGAVWSSGLPCTCWKAEA